MKIHNVRLGFACNSSSTHSIVIFPIGEIPKQDLPGDYSAEGSYGWEDFTLTETEEKMRYFAAQLATSLRSELGAGVAKIVAGEVSRIGRGFPGSDDEWCSGVDHQSVWSFPRRADGTLHLEFLEELREYLCRPEVVILGGNDNSDGHPLRSWGTGAPVDRALSSGALTARRDGAYWALFNKESGAKLRISFKPDAAAYEKASAPELVDLKITDFCPYNCSYCYMGSTHAGKHADSSYIYAVAYALAQLGVFEVAIGGGEPTLHPDFSSIIQSFNRQGIRPAFTTRNMAFLRDPESRSTLELCSAIAISCSSAAEAETAAELKLPCAKTVQYVIGSASSYVLERIAEVCANTHMPLTLLGAKSVGRGGPLSQATETEKQTKEWIQLVTRGFAQADAHEYCRVGIDTVLAQQSEQSLKAKSNKLLYTVKEGAFSMYIDGVAKTMHRSSYETTAGAPLESYDLDAITTYFQSLT